MTRLLPPLAVLTLATLLAASCVRSEPGVVVGRAWLPGKPGRVERWWVIVQLGDGSVTTVEVGRAKWWENGTPVRVRRLRVWGVGEFLTNVEANRNARR